MRSINRIKPLKRLSCKYGLKKTNQTENSQTYTMTSSKGLHFDDGIADQ